MIGTFVNAGVIVLGSLTGIFIIRGHASRFEEGLKKAIALSVIFIGIKGALENQRPLMLIMSLVIGVLLGEFLDIDKHMKTLGNWAEKKFIVKQKNSKNNTKSFSKAFVSASILFCSGAMAIVGPMQDGLQNNHSILFTKSILDGSISIFLAASMGAGTAFSAIPVLVYQGGIALAAMVLQDFLTPDMIREMSASGSLVIAAIGFNFLEIKEIKVANFLPAVFLPVLFLAIEGFF